MNFSIPDDGTERFNRMFADENKTAMATPMLQEAIARAERKAQSDAAFTRILARRQQAPNVSTDDILEICDAVRAESDQTHRPSSR